MIQNKNIYLFYLGVVSAVTQILLLKEFLISFYGNELSIGIILSVWLFWVAGGSFLGHKINRKLRKRETVFSILITSLPLITIAVIVLIKYAPSFLHTPIGEYESVSALAFFAFLVLSINCLLIGYLFSLGAAMPDSGSNHLWMNVNRSYAYEALGSVAGGLFFTFVLNKIFSPFQILVSLSVFVPVYILIFKTKNRMWFVVAAIVIISAYFFVRFITIPEYYFTKEHWKAVNNEMNFVKTVNTKYQNLTLMQLNEQYTLYSDGKPAINFPDYYSSELYVHPIFAQVDNPKNVLLIGGGVSGALYEVLKYGVSKIDYVEPDNDLIRFLESNLDSASKNAIHDSRVNFIKDDGREFVKSTNNKYDVVILASGDPATLNQNRYYTFEFFKCIRNILNKEAVFAFSFASSEDYFGEELENYNISIYQTFKNVFSKFILLPGTKAILIGANGGEYLTYDENILSLRYKAYNLKNSYFSEYMFSQILPKERMNYVLNVFENNKRARINEDSAPITYYFNIVLWNKITKSELFTIQNLTKIKYEYFCLSILIIPILIVVVRVYKPEKVKPLILYSIIFTAGFAGLIVSLILIMNFQTVFGSVYESVGIMVSMNMLGLFAGSLFYGKLKKRVIDKKLPIIIMLVGLLLIIFLPLGLKLIGELRIMMVSFFLMFAYSVIIGLIYSNINYEYLKYSGDVGRIYSIDVFGSLLGAAIFSTLLLPLFGVINIIYFVVLLFSMILILTLYYEYHQ